MHFGSHTFVPISWMCKKQTSVSHSSTESEIISLDTGLRLDGLPALELWDLIVSVFGNISHISDGTERPENRENKHHKSHNKTDAMKDIDSVPSNVQSARQEALLYVFEDNEAVIKMIIKGRSPTMRHVSRTHRVALDWLFDRINLDSKIQIKYIVCVEKLLNTHIQFRTRVSVEEHRAQKYDRFIRGRQIACMIYEHFRATGAYEAVQGLSDVVKKRLQNDDVQEFRYKMRPSSVGSK